MITFFSTAKPFRGTTAIQQENCLQSLLHSAPDCEIFLFDAVEGAADVCKKLGLPQPLDVERSSQDTPRIDAMFGEVARKAKFPVSCFLNCDILITPKFVEIITRLHEEMKADYLLVGQRLNIDCEESLFGDVNWEVRLNELAARGEVHPPYGSDHFVYPTGLFRRDNMPPLLVGRAAWDNWMFYDTLRRGRKLVDLSPEYLVYHQNHDYKFRKINFTGYETDPEAAWNRQFMPKRGRGWHAYKLDRCPLELRAGKFGPKALLYPGEEAEKIIAGGPEAAKTGASETPVAIILFRRADTLRQVIDAIRMARPKYLYAIADTPAEDQPDTLAKCLLARAELDRIDWPCRLRTHFAGENLGLARRMKSGIDWLFTHEERAIILEDDVVLEPDFFPFCEFLLKRYQDDERVGSISAITFAGNISDPESDYYFSRYPHSWGWATWKRAWTGFDLWMEQWPFIRKRGLLAEKFEGEPQALKGWTRILDETYRGKWDTWDFQWTLFCWMKNHLTIHPKASLARNIGDGEGATHTQNSDTVNKTVSGKISLPPRAPVDVCRDLKADEIIFEKYYNYYKPAAAKEPKKAALIEEKPWKKPNFISFLGQLPRLLLMQTIQTALEAGDARYARKHLPKGAPTDTTHLNLKLRWLLATGEPLKAAEQLRKQKAFVAKDPLLLTLKRHFRDLEIKQYPADFQDILRHEPKVSSLLGVSRDVPGIIALKMGEIAYTDVRGLVCDYKDYFVKNELRLSSKMASPLIIDCGAEIGLPIFAFKKQYPEARIIAFEPDAEVFPLLQQNIQRKGFTDVTLHSEALGTDDIETVYNQQSSFERSLGVGLVSRKVPSARLSRFLLEPVALLRLNLDGADLSVLSEARSGLHHVEAILVEYLSSDMTFQSLAPLLAFLAGENFKTSLLTLGGEGPTPLRRYWLPDERNGRLRIYCTR